MADDARVQEARYSGFISYSRKDARFARRLHQRLESYRLPRRAARHATRRIRPLFRDVEEFSASFDLSTAVREALAQSEFLIVVCSPNSAGSKWVGLEIEYFRALHGDSRILAALVDGDSATAFHPALRGGRAFTPLAADFRRHAGSSRLALLRLIAPMTGVELDELVQRDAHRQTRRAIATAAGATAVALVMAGMTTFAIVARADAEHQRNEAQGLVSYLLTDLRKEAKAVGGLELLATVNNGAMQYYRGQDLSKLTDGQLRQRAQLLQAMGEDDEKRGDVAGAAVKFEEARRSTGALLTKKPNDPDRIYAHAQSEYWVGFINWRAGDGPAARRGMDAYAALARRLVALQPDNRDWRHELAYSELNLGTLALRLKGDGVTAERHFRSALQVLERLALDTPEDVGVRREVADAYAWLADSRRVDGDLDGALSSRREERAILDSLSAERPQDLEIRSDLIGNELAVARIYMARGQTSAALAHLEHGRERAAELARIDPSNADVAKQARMLDLFRVSAMLSAPRDRRASPLQLRRTLGSCEGAQAPLDDTEIVDFCRLLEARIESTGEPGRVSERIRNLPPPTTRYSKRWGIDMVHEHELILANEGKGGL